MVLITEYREHAAEFLMRVVREPEVVSVRVETAAQKKLVWKTECTYRIAADSVSNYSEKLLKGILNKKDAEVSDDVLNSTKSKARERILTGAIHLLCVLYLSQL